MLDDHKILKGIEAIITEIVKNEGEGEGYITFTLRGIPFKITVRIDEEAIMKITQKGEE